MHCIGCEVDRGIVWFRSLSTLSFIVYYIWLKCGILAFWCEVECRMQSAAAVLLVAAEILCNTEHSLCVSVDNAAE